jgi:hypothetical protein
MGRVRMADRHTGRPLRFINGRGLSSANPPGHSRHIDESIKKTPVWASIIAAILAVVIYPEVDRAYTPSPEWF